jgi:hypothetical protein
LPRSVEGTPAVLAFEQLEHFEETQAVVQLSDQHCASEGESYELFSVRKQTLTSTIHCFQPKINTQRDLAHFKIVEPYDKIGLILNNGQVCAECGCDFDEECHIV